ncbi:hypothetical protein Psuf_066070 [Phytohabitans suffuscus]|uniref:Uncharacterized protein n=1 Tax=Phytohabitans suffuscus TaxID=624315 RepID=A0A6F8YT51_9ACTN|nr:hypothetical protein Psuf_066070 [Phytohabitans suffuscus]
MAWTRAGAESPAGTWELKLADTEEPRDRFQREETQPYCHPRLGAVVGDVAVFTVARHVTGLAFDVYALSARTRSGRVRGRPRPSRATLIFSNTATNCGLSPRCPAV